MDTKKASAAGQNHAELVRAGVAQSTTFIADSTRNVVLKARKAYAVTQPVVAEKLGTAGHGAKHGAKVAVTYVGAFLRTLVSRSSRVD